VAAYTESDGFHEIQLNGKQLVFLFMAATVVSVVIFLCGVLVGRGVRAERGDLTQGAGSESAPVDVAPAPSAIVPPLAGEVAPNSVPGQPPTPVDELTYFNRLEKPTPALETLKSVAEKPVPAPAPVAPPRPAAAEPSARSAAARSDTPAPAPMTAQGWAVQVAALNVRGEADAMAKRLSSKGYSAYVVSPTSSTPSMFRVRIGTFKTRREAEAMAATLQKEEQFKPWVTR
jgi:cell division septation protein DedD